MKINKQTKKFRSTRAKELREIAKVLEKLNIDPKKKVYDAARKLEGSSPIGFEQHPSVWGYSAKDIVFHFEDIPSHTKPSKLTNLQLKLDVSIAADVTCWCEDSDPTLNLSINILIVGTAKGKNTPLYYAMHIDRQPDDGDKPKEIHPKYHLQYGGDKVPNTIDYGDLMLFAAPRVQCVPMDLILAIDFILGNFFPDKWEKFRNDARAASLLKMYQSAFYYPYFNCISSHWSPTSISNGLWKPSLILPDLN